MPKAVDLTGQTFGRLTVVGRAGSDVHGNIMWECQCACGGSIKTRANSLRSGHTISCGCAGRANLAMRTKHGAATRSMRTSEYGIWGHMIQRCSNPKYHNFQYWGGRGISVCREWRDSFEAFLAHIGPRPSRKHSLDRFPDVNGNYEPGNVRWATRAEQLTNSRDRGPALSATMKRLHRERPGWNHASETTARRWREWREARHVGG
jgi:hypothetical protein